MPSIKEYLTEIGLSHSFVTSQRRNIQLGGFGKSIIGIRGWLGGWNKDGLIKYSQERNLSGTLMGIGLQNNFVDSYVKRICEEINKRPNSTIVGYSMGGVIALRYLQFHGSSKVDKLILIGCPLNGARQASYLQKFGGAYRDLSTQSKILRDLQNFDPKIPTFHLLANWDQFVGDPQKIQGFGKKIILPINGHLQLMNNYHRVATVLDEII